MRISPSPGVGIGRFLGTTRLPISSTIRASMVAMVGWTRTVFPMSKLRERSMTGVAGIEEDHDHVCISRSSVMQWRWKPKGTLIECTCRHERPEMTLLSAFTADATYMESLTSSHSSPYHHTRKKSAMTRVATSGSVPTIGQGRL